MAPENEREESSRDRVLRSAAAEFAERGFAGARIDRIAKGARSNVRMLYYWFESKEGLYRVVLREAFERAAAVVAQIDDGVRAGTVDLGNRDTYRLMFQQISHDPSLVDLLIREFIDGGPHLRKLLADRPDLHHSTHGKLEQLFRHGVDTGVFRPMSEHELMLLIFSTVWTVIALRRTHDIFLLGEERTLAEMSETLIDVFLNGVVVRSEREPRLSSARLQSSNG